MHALIVGTRGIGKSTLIRRVLAKTNRPVSGFETKKEDDLADEMRGSPVYIYDAGKKHIQTEENLIGYTGKKEPQVMKIAFDRYAPKLLLPIPRNNIILMDELGIMESLSDAFCGAVMQLLDGDTPVIAAVKDKDTPFLNAVRTHPNCRCFYISEDNRDELYNEVLDFMRMQLDPK